MTARWLSLASMLALVSCGTSRGTGTAHDLAGTGSGGDGFSDGDGGGGMDQSAEQPDLLQLDGPPGTAYDDLGKSDSGLCQPPMMGMSCANPIANNAGCGAVELCGSD